MPKRTHYPWLPTIMLAASLPLQAAEWSFEPRVTLTNGFIDNIRLTTDRHDSVWETALTPGTKFSLAQENRGLSGDLSGSIRRFFGGSGQEDGDRLASEDYRLNTQAWRNTELTSLNVDLDFKRDTTLDGEAVGGRIVDERATRHTIIFAPSWGYSISELSRIDLSYSYNNLEYTDDPGVQNFVDYKYHVVSGTYVRQLTERFFGTLSARHSNLKPASGFDSETLALTAGLRANFSETLLGSVSVGQRQTTSDTFIGAGFCVGANPGATFPTCDGGTSVPTGPANAELDTDSFVFSADITRRLQAGSVTAELSRSSSPSSLGELLDTTSLSLTGNRKVTETVEATLTVELTENETIVNRVGVPDQDEEVLFRIRPGFRWRLDRSWLLSGDFRYARNDDPDANGIAIRRALYLNIVYQPPKRSVSR